MIPSPVDLSKINSSAFNRSVSNIQSAKSSKVSQKQTILQRIGKFLKGISHFLRGVFKFSSASAKQSNLNMPINSDNKNLTSPTNDYSLASKDVSSLETSGSDISKQEIFKKELIKKYGADFSLTQLRDQMTGLGFKEDVTQLNDIVKTSDHTKLAQVDLFQAKVAYQTSFNQIKDVVSDPILLNNNAVKNLSTKITDFQTQFSDISGPVKSNQTVNFFNDRIQDLQQLSSEFKTNLKSDFSSVDSYFKKEMVTIKTDVLRSTNTYVKNGEIEHKQLVAKAYQRSAQFIELAISKRTDSIKGAIKSHLPQVSNETNEDYNNRITDFFEKTKNLYTEKHFHLTASVLQGDQYVKGWATQGRDSAAIDADIEQLCGSRSDFVQTLNGKFDTILDGLSQTILVSSNHLIKTAHQNDLMSSRMKAIHEMTVGLDDFITELGHKDFSTQSLQSISDDIKQTNKMMSNFKVLSKEFVVGEESLTHLDRKRVQGMIDTMLPQNQFKTQASKDDFVLKMTNYIMGRLEYKGAVDSQQNDYGTIHSEILPSLKFKDAVLVKMDDFKKLNDDKVTGAWSGRVESRGPYNRAFIAYTDGMKSKLIQHLNDGKGLERSDISQLIESVIAGVDCKDDQQVDQRRNVTDLLINYTDALLKKSGVIATGDSGLIKEATPQTMTSYTKQLIFGSESNFVLKSKKSEFLSSDLYKTYGSQFDLIAPSLESQINQTLQTGLEQGQVGQLRSIIKDLKSQPKFNFTESLTFKAKLAENRIFSFLNASSDDQFRELNSLREAKNTVNDLTSKGVDDPEQQARVLRMKMNSKSEMVDHETESSSNPLKDGINDINQHIQSSVDALLSSDLNTKLLAIQSGSGDIDFEKASDDLKLAVSSVESTLEELKSFLIDSGNIAFDHVDDVLMSVPYVGELYSAVAVAKDIKDGYFAATKMDAMKTQLNMTTGFNRYLTNANIQQDQLSGNIHAFSTMLQAENQRDAATFSLLVHVTNALSPPGVNIGSALKLVKEVVTMPSLDSKQMDKIAEEVMTVNQNYMVLAKESKDDALNQLMGTLKEKDANLGQFKQAVIEASDTLPSANDFTRHMANDLFK